MNKHHEDNAVKTAPQTQKPDRGSGPSPGPAQQAQRPATVNPAIRPQGAPAPAAKAGEKPGAQPQKRS